MISITNSNQYNDDIVAITFIWLFVIAHLVIWILGIINAIEINKLTQSTAALIVFSIIPIYFIHLIVAIITKNKFANHIPNVHHYKHIVPSKDQHLKDAFLSGAITSKEYEEKNIW